LEWVKLFSIIFSEFILSDTVGNVTAINAATGIVTGRYRGVAGAVTDIYACKNQPYVVMIALDRRLRIFEESNQRRMVKDVNFELI
jgi:ribosome biogenesis protein NSA1